MGRSKSKKISNVDKQLFDAVKRGDLEGVKEALDAGANPNAKDKDGNTPLNKLCQVIDEGDITQTIGIEEVGCRGTKRFLKIADLLLEKGADINHVGSSDQTPLINAICRDNLCMIRFLLNKGAKVTSMALSVAQTRLDIAKEGVESGYGDLLPGAVKLREAIKNTLLEGQLKQQLFPNISEQDFELVRVLITHDLESAKKAIKNGANVNVKSKEGSTILIMAAMIGYTDFVRLLLENKADPNIVNQYKNTPLIYAAYNNNVAIVKLLLAFGAKTDIVNSQGKTASDLTSNDEIKALLKSESSKKRNH